MNQQLETHRARQLLFNNLTRITHRNYDPLVTAFRDALESDPDFISRAMTYVATNSNVRDQVDCAIITLLQSPPQYDYREAGRCLFLGSDVYDIEPTHLPGLPPYRVFRVWNYIRSSDRKVSRLMRNVMSDYLVMLDHDPLRFDGVAIHNRRALRDAFWYYRASVEYSDRTNDILFRDTPPPDSKLAVLKEIANSTNPREQARLVIEHRIPYRIATSVLPKMNAAVAIALIDAMSPTEALNSRAWVERSGVLNIPEVKDVYVEKVGRATRSVASADHRVSAKGEDAEVEAAVQAAKETATREAARIERDTLLMVDISYSMGPAIDAAQKFGARIAPLCDGGLMVVAFNDYGREIKVQGRSLQAWQQAFRGVRVGGYTSMQAGYELAVRHGFEPEQVVVITDGGENRGNLAAYLRDRDVVPHFVIIGVAGETASSRTSYHAGFARGLERAGVPLDEFVVETGDYYIFDQVSAILGGERAPSLVERILEVTLPRRVGH